MFLEIINLTYCSGFWMINAYSFLSQTRCAFESSCWFNVLYVSKLYLRFFALSICEIFIGKICSKFCHMENIELFTPDVSHIYDSTDKNYSVGDLLTFIALCRSNWFLYLLGITREVKGSKNYESINILFDLAKRQLL